MVTLKVLHARLTNFKERAPTLRLWGSRVDLVEERETGLSLSLALSPNQDVLVFNSEARTGASSALAEDCASFVSGEMDSGFWCSASDPTGAERLAEAHTGEFWAMCALAPIALLPGVLAKVRQQGSCLLLIASRWLTRVWFSEMVSLLDSLPWAIPNKRYRPSVSGTE